jgi:putative redox protein
MPRKKITFPGRGGELAGALELPESQAIGFALFAHCFTCGKDSIAASRVSRHLAAAGIGVLRFDFTGLGGSDGDFASSHFSANIEDIVAAADYLRTEYTAPTLLIGHSLGGTAVLAAAARVAEAKAVVAIAAPSSPDHILTQFGASLEAIERDGEADVNLGGRTFRLDRSFLHDLSSHPMPATIRGLRKALLIMHSPVDSVVGIDEASEIFSAALHPKSFVSLDDADHLLSRPDDAEFVAATIAGWSARYFTGSEAASTPTLPAGHVTIAEENHRFLRRVLSDDHSWLADEPRASGGDNLGPDPYELLLAALGSCTSMTLRLYANRKQWALEDIDVELSHTRDHGPDCARCDEPDQIIDVISRRIRLSGDLSDEQRSRLLEIADRCPVHRTLAGDLRIETAPVTG